LGLQLFALNQVSSYTILKRSEKQKKSKVRLLLLNSKKEEGFLVKLKSRRQLSKKKREISPCKRNPDVKEHIWLYLSFLNSFLSRKSSRASLKQLWELEMIDTKLTHFLILSFFFLVQLFLVKFFLLIKSSFKKLRIYLFYLCLFLFFQQIVWNYFYFRAKKLFSYHSIASPPLLIKFVASQYFSFSIWIFSFKLSKSLFLLDSPTRINATDYWLNHFLLQKNACGIH